MNKKILFLCTLFISIFIFINDTNAKVMWVQCSNDGKIYAIENSDDVEGFKLYGTYAVVNSVMKMVDGAKHSETRWLAYYSKNMFAEYGPTFIQHKDAGGTTDGISCWRNEYFEDVEECDQEDGYYFITENGGTIPLEKGYCPEGVIQTGNTQGSTKGDFIVPWGINEKVHDIATIESKGELVIYGFKKKDNGKTVDIMVEGYDGEGHYGYATTWKDWDYFVKFLGDGMNITGSGNNLVNSDGGYDRDYISWEGMTQVKRIANIGKDYFNLTGTRDSWLINTAPENSRGFIVSEKNDDDEPVMFTNKPDDENFKSWIDNWYGEVGGELEKYIENITEIESKNKLISTAEEIEKADTKGTRYNFDEDNYSVETMIDDLEYVYEKLKEFTDKNDILFPEKGETCNEDTEGKNPLTSAYSNFMCDVFGVTDIIKLEHYSNGKYLNDIIISTIAMHVNDVTNSTIGIDSIDERIEKYVRSFSIAVGYLNKYSSDYGINIGVLKEKYEELAAYYDIQIINDCESLIGENLKNKIHSYLNIIKIAIPILLIGLGIIDFTKALFAGDDDKMRKAQKDFLLRLGISILFFLLPIIVDLILNLANKVWYFIDPSSCGLF